MANSKLKHRIFHVPDEVIKVLYSNLKKLSDKRDSKGYNRALFILQRRECTYEQLKRIKNYFDYIDPNDPNTYNEVEYLLNGGKTMKEWINYTLDQARREIKGNKEAMTHAGMSNQFRQASVAGDGIKAVTPHIKAVPEFMGTSDLMEEINKIKELTNNLLNG